MLKNLHIQNYAIIDELTIKFSSQLNIITGETGAGKSILMGALGLILGNRADTSVLSDKEKKCVIEGSFSTAEKKEVKSFLKANDLDETGELVARREITANGKSRAFINDTPVNLSQLQQLSSLLVDLHQQFDTLELTENDFQREVLDALAGNENLLQQYQAVYKNYLSVKKEWEELTVRQSSANKELDYYKFLFGELEDVSLKENELEELETELKLLNSSEEIKSVLSAAVYSLQEGEQPVVQQLKALVNQLNSFASLHTQLPELVQRLQSSQIEISDIASELEYINDAVNYDAKRIEIVNDRLSAGYKLLKKHSVKTTNELLLIQADLEQKLQQVLNIEEMISKKLKATEQLLKEATAISSKLTEQRIKQVKPLEDKVNKLLLQVGMPNARLKVEVKSSALNLSGADAIEFLFDANKNNRFEPVSKVASGGELSRLMLSIKSLVAQSVSMPTLIFDEIDTGISGEAARQVGIIMKGLAKRHQVIAITHQPQIAARADAHYFVYKKESLGKIKTHVRLLDDKERVEAIAKMLSGEQLSDASIKIAKEMVEG
ncbi:MAG: DNA repair protein RecN [Sphingobacteriales bacterium]|nr:DNA repair protein RecN [Sphingobacteriales bacterium]